MSKPHVVDIINNDTLLRNFWDVVASTSIFTYIAHYHSLVLTLLCGGLFVFWAVTFKHVFYLRMRMQWNWTVVASTFALLTVYILIKAVFKNFCVVSLFFCILGIFCISLWEFWYSSSSSKSKQKEEDDDDEELVPLALKIKKSIGKGQQQQQRQHFCHDSNSNNIIVSKAAKAAKGRLVIAILFFAIILWYHVLGAEPLSYFRRNDGMIPQPRCACLRNKSCVLQDLQTTRQDYINLHRRILSSETPLSEKRFIVYVASNDGLGNRIQGLLSTYLLAILTDRALLVEWDATDMSAAAIGDLFENPGFEWTSNSALYDAVYNNQKEDNNNNIKSPQWIGYCRTCAIRSQSLWEEVYTNLMCEPDQSRLGVFSSDDDDDKTIRIQSTQWYAPALAHNPAFRDKICTLFDKDLYRNLSALLLKPIPEIQSRIDSFKEQYFNQKSHRVVAIQLRRQEAYSVSAVREESNFVFVFFGNVFFCLINDFFFGGTYSVCALCCFHYRKTVRPTVTLIKTKQPGAMVSCDGFHGCPVSIGTKAWR